MVESRAPLCVMRRTESTFHVRRRRLRQVGLGKPRRGTSCLLLSLAIAFAVLAKAGCRRIRNSIGGLRDVLRTNNAADLAAAETSVFGRISGLDTENQRTDVAAGERMAYDFLPSDVSNRLDALQDMFVSSGYAKEDAMHRLLKSAWPAA